MSSQDQSDSPAVERDQRAIAKDLQDNVEQLLTAAVIELGSIARIAAKPEVAEQIEHTRAVCRQALEQTRALMSELDPPVLFELGLGAALDWLVEQHSRRTGIAVSFVDQTGGRRLDGEVAETLFQGARTALDNVARQGRGSRVAVQLALVDDSAMVDIRDDVGTQAMLFAPLEPELPSRRPNTEPQLEEQ